MNLVSLVNIYSTFNASSALTLAENNGSLLTDGPMTCVAYDCLRYRRYGPWTMGSYDVTMR